jgi:UDP-2,3-diacylglucosamine pyrophosphatase LpxH
MICGHLHRFLYHDADSKIHFPIVVNSLDTVLKGTIERKTLTIEVKDKAGNTIDTKNYSGK